MAANNKLTLSELNSIIDRYGGDRGQVIAILNEVQDRERYLPEWVLREVAVRLGVPLVQVYGIATFFRAFSLEPRGRHRCVVCMGTACHVRGAPRVLAEVERVLGVGVGGTTVDGEFSLDTVNCVGACALGPLLIVDGNYHGGMIPGKVGKVLDSYRGGGGRGGRVGEGKEEKMAAGVVGVVKGGSGVGTGVEGEVGVKMEEEAGEEVGGGGRSEGGGGGEKVGGRGSGGIGKDKRKGMEKAEKKAEVKGLSEGKGSKRAVGVVCPRRRGKGK